MAEAPLKRQREEAGHDGEDYVVGEDTKRHKTYNQILSLLEAEEEVPIIQDLPFLMSTLEHELSCDSIIIDPLVFFTSSDDTTTIHTENPSKFTIPDCSSSSTSDTNNNSLKEDVDEERVIRHLLEASDDELGIPSQAEIRYTNIIGEDDDEINGGDGFFSVCHGLLWEFEDEAANYYTYLQSQLFI